MHPNDPDRKARQLEMAQIDIVPLKDPTGEVFDPESSKPTDDPFPEELQDYSSMTVPELKALCAERNIAVSGIKTELIERLNLDDTSHSTEAPVEETAVIEEEAVPEESAAVEETVEGEVSESGGENSGNPTE
tara:strand:- start:20182 stop:20580 length:399 start_codon:yes stop_codon:yes gene_type:complete